MIKLNFRLNSKDTIRAFLRNNVTPYHRVDSSKSILDSLTFTAELNFNNAVNGNYFLEISHRNSINTWSKLPVTHSAMGGFNYDFTDSPDKAFGNNMVLEGNKWCIYSGDVFRDGVVDPSDMMMIDNDAANFGTGYLSSDVNGDKFVDSSDLLVTDNNALNYIIQIEP